MFATSVAAMIAAGAPAHAADTVTTSELAGCSSGDPSCSTPPASPLPSSSGSTTSELPKVIAWTSAYDINPFNGSKGGIFISFADGSAQRRLTEFDNGNKELTEHGLNAPDDHPSFSHDGRQIVFTSNRANRDDWDIYVMDVNGQNVRRLTATPGLDTEPVFSPDDTLIAFASERGGNLGIWVMRANGTNPHPVIDTPIAEIEPAWRPDGNQLAFVHSVTESDKDLFTIDVTRRAKPLVGESDLTTGAVRQLTAVTGEDHDPTYSPDGSEIVFTTQRAPFDPPFGNIHKLRLSDLADEGDLTSDLDLGAADPFWSFDGKRIAFFKSTTSLIHSPQQLWIMAADGSHKVQLPAGSGVANVHPAIGRVADVNGDGTADFLESASVGRPSVEVARRVRAGRDFSVRFGWTHPTRWRLLRSEQLVITLGRVPVGLIRFDVPSQLFFIWDSARGGYGAHGRAGDRRTLRAGVLSVDLRQTRVIKQSRRTLTLDLGLTLDRRAAGRTFGLQARADDARGASQQDRRARAAVTVS